MIGLAHYRHALIQQPSLEVAFQLQEQQTTGRRFVHGLRLRHVWRSRCQLVVVRPIAADGVRRSLQSSSVV